MENRMNAELTRNRTRLCFYMYGWLPVISIVLHSREALLSEKHSGLHKTVYMFLVASAIAYAGLLVRCNINDAPIPSYRLEGKWQLPIYLATMTLHFWIACLIKDDDIMVETSLLALLLQLAVHSIVQLYFPAEDFDQYKVLFNMSLGIVFALVGGLARESWTNFFMSLCLFPVAICCIFSFAEALGWWEQPRDLDHPRCPL